jgi:hypothetical protein
MNTHVLMYFWHIFIKSYLISVGISDEEGKKYASDYKLEGNLFLFASLTHFLK